MSNTELKPCEYCGETPELQRGVEWSTNSDRFRCYCRNCNIASKSAYTTWGAIEAWNRRANDGA